MSSFKKRILASRPARFIVDVVAGTQSRTPVRTGRTATDLRELEDKLDHTFRNRELLRQAVTHKSHAHEAQEADSFHNESMEFLGDAVLGFLITDVIYHAFPSASEGRLSKIRAYLVSSASLFLLAKKIDLPQYLRLGKGEEKTGGRKKRALSANAFEAVIAAIYLDAGIETVRAFLDPLYAPIIDAIRSGRAIVEDPKTTLQELLQARNMPPAQYVVTAETGPEHRKIFHVDLHIGDQLLASASGTTKKKAELQTAEIALRQLTSRRPSADKKRTNG
jgi:ribonuclease-3